MDAKQLTQLALEALRQAGADQAQVEVTEAETSELNVEAGALSLFRTTVNLRLSLTAFVGGRRGSALLNQADPDSIHRAAQEAVAYAQASAPDPANAIAPFSPPQRFQLGAEAPDAPAMYDRLKEFLADTGRRYPKTKLEQCLVDFTLSRTVFGNSHGVLFDQTGGLYDFSAMFTTKDGPKTTSFNYGGGVRQALDSPFAEWGSVDLLMDQSTRQLDPQPVSGSFVGEVILTPDCLMDVVGSLAQGYLSDFSLITGSSPFKDHLGQSVAWPGLTLWACPASDLLQHRRYFTEDGFAAVDAPLIKGGILKNYLLSLYGANKTGRPRSPNTGGGWMIDAGMTPLDQMIGSVNRGLLLCRLSGGSPSDNGDFTGVAKNSFLIENGQIRHAVTETMVAGNLGQLLRSITAISRERTDFGHAVFPWILAGGVTISGS